MPTSQSQPGICVAPRIPRIVVFLVWLTCGSGAASELPAIDFDREIRPLLADRCFACHGPDEAARKGELRLDEPHRLTGSDRPVVVPGDAAGSILYQKITSADPEQVMPPVDFRKRLSDSEKELIRRWIDEGGRWALHWSWAPVVKQEPPAFSSVSHPVDQFVRDRLQQAGMRWSAEADRVTLIRRIHFDLTGLPPTWEQVEAFVRDGSPNAWEKVVDDLLQSPHFGERLAISWLDIVRFADSNGYHSDEPRRIAPYRDYVIQAFNKNKPFDRFVVEQLAGDLLPDATTEQQVASGFNMLLQTTSEGGAQAGEYIAKYAADRVRNTSQIFLGSTLGCAECHDHKYDPFTMQDFYSFAAFFADIEQPAVGNPANFPVMNDAERNHLAALDAQLAEQSAVLTTFTPELRQAQSDWESVMRTRLQTSPESGPWHVIGPFPAESFAAAIDTAFLDPASPDLNQPVRELRWQPAPDFTDGTVHELAAGEFTATYLYRTITVTEPTPLMLSLGSDDAIAVWLNGKLVHDNKVSRAAAAGQDQVAVAATAGVNSLVIRIANDRGKAGFCFSATHSDVPENIRAILLTAPGDRDADRQNELGAYYLTVAPLLQPHRDRLAGLQAERKAFDDALPRTMMTRTGSPKVVRLLNRGNWMDESGPEMQPAVPLLPGTSMPPAVAGGEPRRATRLDLANWIVRRDNPLTARTMVNRLWKLYFGQGLATPLDDLGRQGSAPTHPELLDWLAAEFMDRGWDVKQMVRLLVTSATYRQSSIATEDSRRTDPYNTGYGRQLRFRLDAELVRDNALAVSGLLVHDLGGRSVHPWQPVGYWRHLNFPMREWPVDQGDNLYRRGVYTWWQRMFLHPALVAFDAPSREECTVERPRSNIPQQALVLLNDPVFVEAARVFAARILQEAGGTEQERLNWAFRTAVSRDVLPREAELLLALQQENQAQYRRDPAAADALLATGAKPVPDGMDRAELAAWTAVARVILNLSETITRP